MTSVRSAQRCESTCIRRLTANALSLQNVTDKSIRPAAGPTHALLAKYGEAMHAVQVYELNLATLTLTVRLASSAKLRKADEDMMVHQIRHLAQKASASEMRRVLDTALDPVLLEEITTLIGWRNFLAHRYLRTRFYDKELRVRATPEQIDELEKLRAAFATGAEKVGAARDRIALATFGSDTAPTMDAREQALLMRILQNAPSTFENVLKSRAGDEE
jgi:hypothetical protein